VPIKQFAIVVFALVVCAGRATADPVPWETGVSEAEQKQARELFEEGNQLFAQQAHAPALEKYQAALAHWDHPLIRFNLAVTLIRLDRTLEAADALEHALRYKDQPFTKDLYQQALDYQALLKNQVGYVEASCDQAGAHVLLDGKPWLDCPGTKKLRVLAGEHVIIGERETYATSSQRVVVAGGATVSRTVKLVPLDRAVILKYPYRRWIPWTISGGGAAIVAVGLGFWLSGRSNMDRYNTQLEIVCASGCPANLAGDEYSLLRQARDSGRLQGKIGIATMAAGGAVTALGVVLAIVNRPKRILPPLEVAPTNGGVTASVGWQF
jgi:hypothetical protein